jgi:hypothetical protein
LLQKSVVEQLVSPFDPKTLFRVAI